MNKIKSTRLFYPEELQKGFEHCMYLVTTFDNGNESFNISYGFYLVDWHSNYKVTLDGVVYYIEISDKNIETLNEALKYEFKEIKFEKIADFNDSMNKKELYFDMMDRKYAGF